MKYHIRGALNGGAQITENGWKANSVYDPNPATGITQKSAQTFTYWGQYYTQYSVLESKLVLTFSQTSGTSQPVQVAVTTNTTGLGPLTGSDWDAWLSTGRIKTFYMDTGKSRKVVSRWSCKRFGIDRDSNTGVLGGTGVGTDPDNVDYHVVAAACVNPANSFAAGTPNIWGTIYYKVLLFDRKAVPFAS